MCESLQAAHEVDYGKYYPIRPYPLEPHLLEFSDEHALAF